MKAYSSIIIMILVLFANVVVAQDVDSLATKPVVDSMVMAADSVKPKADSVSVRR